MTSAHPLRGVLLCLAAAFLFACMDTTIKYLTAHYPAPLVVAIRYIVLCVLMTVLLAPSQGRALVRTQRTALVLTRAACLAAASLFLALALKRMPVAEATAMLFLAPVVVVLLAGPFLHEYVGATGWVAAIIGFAGVLLIARPGSGLDAIGFALGLCAAAVTALYQLLSRVLASSERTVTLLFYTALVGAVAFGMALPWFWPEVTPTPWQMLMFAGVGVMGGLGHFLFTAAHRYAPASLLAPIMYAQLLWALLLGWIVFGHVPAGASFVGMGLVTGAGVLVAVKSRIAARAMAQPTEN